MAKATQIKAEKPESKKGPSYIVVKEFRDKEDFNKQHNVDDDVSHFDQSRIDHLISIGHVEVK